MNKIYVGNLNYKSTKEELEAYFSQFGGISDVAVPTDKLTNRPRGFAFITFNNPADAQKACTATNGAEFSGRILKVNPAEARTSNNRDDRNDREDDRW